MSETLPLYVQMLLAVRQKHGWTQQQLANALGVSRRTIVNWENGHQEPPLMLMVALRQLL